MPDPGGNPNPPDKPGLEIFHDLEQLVQRAKRLQKEGFELEFVLAKYKEN